MEHLKKITESMRDEGLLAKSNVNVFVYVCQVHHSCFLFLIVFAHIYMALILTFTHESENLDNIFKVKKI